MPVVPLIQSYRSETRKPLSLLLKPQISYRFQRGWVVWTRCILKRINAFIKYVNGSIYNNIVRVYFKMFFCRRIEVNVKVGLNFSTSLTITLMREENDLFWLWTITQTSHVEHERLHFFTKNFSVDDVLFKGLTFNTRPYHLSVRIACCYGKYRVFNISKDNFSLVTTTRLLGDDSTLVTELCCSSGFLFLFSSLEQRISKYIL